jgi:hypothetical protein
LRKLHAFIERAHALRGGTIAHRRKFDSAKSLDDVL